MSDDANNESETKESAYDDEVTREKFSISDDRIRYWSTLDMWTPSEASALILLLDPDYVNVKYIERMSCNSVILKKFKDNKRIIERSDNLTGDDSPKDIIEVLISKNVSISERLLNNVNVYQELNSNKINKLKVINKKLRNDIDTIKKNMNERRIDSMKKII